MSGTTPVTINGTPRLTLATSVPLWRDLPRESRGADVDALQAELHRLGHDVSTDRGAIGPATLAAVAALDKPAAVLDDGAPGIRRTVLLWLPRARAIVAECLQPVGSTATPGQPLLTVEQPVTHASAALPNPPFAAGGRELDVSGTKLPVSDSGTIADPAALDTLAAMPVPAEQEAGQARSMAATWQLTHPIDVAAVPAAAVLGTAEHSCVASQGRSYDVDVVGSQLGETYVVFRNARPTSVAIDLPRNTPCG